MNQTADIWILSQSRTGDLNQMIDLAEAVGAPFVVKRLPRPAPGEADGLRLLLGDAPAPRLVISGERTLTPLALAVKARSGGGIRAVSIGRPGERVEAFDLVITAPHFRMRPAPNVLELSSPLHRLDEAGIRNGIEALREDVAALPRPFTVALIGGSSSPERLDAKEAAILGRRLVERTRFTGGSLLLTTSPRTSADAAEQLARAASAAGRAYLWSRNMPINPYKGLLGLADEFVATSDSASMPIEAALTGKPVYLYRLPRKASPRLLSLEAAERCRRWLPPVEALFHSGALEARADRRLLFDPLVRMGVMREFSENDSTWIPTLLESSVEGAAAAIRALLRAHA